jgi:leucyl-tRNA synthetase
MRVQAEIAVNWCPALGTVLANEEVRAARRVSSADGMRLGLMVVFCLWSPARLAGH